MKAIIYAERHGFHLVGDLGQVGTHLILGRNLIHERAVKDAKADYTGVVWVDSDMVLPNDAIVTLLRSVEQTRAHFMAAQYFKRSGDNGPVCGVFGPERDPEGYALIHSKVALDSAGVQRLKDGACGFGLTYTSLELLKAMPYRPFTRLPFIFEPGDDYSFCWRVKEYGNPEFDLWLNHDITGLGHLGAGQIVTRDTFVARKRAEENTKSVPA
jgi:hypothetical protein